MTTLLRAPESTVSPTPPPVAPATRRPRVVYWNNIPAPYMVERFNALARRDTLDFEAWFTERLEPDRSWLVDEAGWEFRARYVPAVRVAGRRVVLPLPAFTAPAPDVFVSLYAEPPYLAGWWAMRRRGARTAFWVEVTFDSWVRRRGWKEQMKRWLFPRADGILTVGADGSHFARRYGARPEQIHFTPHVIDVDFFAAGADAARPQRERLRAELGLRGVTFLNIGRLWWGKGLGHLLDAFAALQRRSADEVSLLLVGDGPEEAALRRRCAAEGIRNVVFVGFTHKPELPRLYTAADVFVFPTLGDPYGLVVDEAMACSLPVISSTAAGEIRPRVEDQVTGFLVPPANSAALLDRMEALALDPARRAAMGAAGRRAIAGHTPEQWAADFEEAVARLCAGGAAMRKGGSR